MMRQNVGLLDRITRIVLGLILIGARYFFKVSGLPGDGMVLVGALWVWEGMLGYCLLYGIFRWSTKQVD
jgi:Inner membrane protein YgaP-like, transmembrane domain